MSLPAKGSDFGIIPLVVKGAEICSGNMGQVLNRVFYKQKSALEKTIHTQKMMQFKTSCNE